MSRRSVLPVIRTPHPLVAGLAAFGPHAAAATVLFSPQHRPWAVGARPGAPVVPPPHVPTTSLSTLQRVTPPTVWCACSRVYIPIPSGGLFLLRLSPVCKADHFICVWVEHGFHQCSAMSM